MALQRVTTNFLEREFRTDYSRALWWNRPGKRAADILRGLIAYGLNRRLMIEVVTQYQWNEMIGRAHATHGATGQAVARLQLVDTPTSSHAFQVGVTWPNTGTGDNFTSITPVFAGWFDVQNWIPALDRVGLYYSIALNTVVPGIGLMKNGQVQNQLNYDLTFAKTWTGRDFPVFRNLTTFLETYATSTLDGYLTTFVELTPGIRFWFLPAHSVIFGMDIPMNHPLVNKSSAFEFQPNPYYNFIYRFTYILNFD
ncbi:MAG TPA: hypothetical protein VMK12_10405 [Anaeromyxobacteraceae bacterium]|nr:hypothetical protein [Anaeromyxobacteraceae bacterium]